MLLFASHAHISLHSPAVPPTSSPPPPALPLPLPVPLQRREYDSIDEFDDSLPTECASADFYKVRSRRDITAAAWAGHSVASCWCGCAIRCTAQSILCMPACLPATNHPTNQVGLPVPPCPTLPRRCLAPPSAATPAGPPTSRCPTWETRRCPWTRWVRGRRLGVAGQGWAYLMGRCSHRPCLHMQHSAQSSPPGGASPEGSSANWIRHAGPHPVPPFPLSAPSFIAAGGCFLQLLVQLQELARVPAPRRGGH